MVCSLYILRIIFTHLLDDGPSLQTPQLLDYLEEQDLQATFFVVGSRVVSFPHILQQEYMSGHQIAVHTWSHPSLTTLTNDEIIAELGWSRQAIQDVLGVAPSAMRPPYGDIEWVHCLFQSFTTEDL